MKQKTKDLLTKTQLKQRIQTEEAKRSLENIRGESIGKANQRGILRNLFEYDGIQGRPGKDSKHRMDKGSLIVRRSI